MILKAHSPPTDEQHAHLLTPSFALAGLLPDPPAYQNMSQEELNAFVGEMENDIRSADRDMQEIDALQKKGVTGAGKLAGMFLSNTVICVSLCCVPRLRAAATPS